MRVRNISPEHRSATPPSNLKDGWYTSSIRAKSHYIKSGYAVCCGDYRPNNKFKRVFPFEEKKCLFCVHALHFIECVRCNNQSICEGGIKLRNKIGELEIK
jgi:hypothetical protein